MAREDAEREGSCQVAAVVSGVALLLALFMAQHHFVSMKHYLAPQYQRLNADLPDVTMSLVANYPSAPGYIVIAFAVAWLLAAVFWRRGTPIVVVNCVLLLLVELFMTMQGWAAVFPYANLGQT